MVLFEIDHFVAFKHVRNLNETKTLSLSAGLALAVLNVPLLELRVV